MKLFSLLLLLPFFYTSLCSAREITHEDIKDAMLSLVHMMRENTEKLERHEVREKQLGEQLKKAISALTKRLSVIDGMKLAKLDERIAGVEQLIAQRDERERIQMQKTADALEDLEVRLEGWLTDLETKMTKTLEDSNASLNNNKINPEILSKLNNTESLIMGHITNLEYTIKSTSMELHDTMANQSEKVELMATKLENVNDNLKNSIEVIKESSKLSDQHLNEPLNISSLVQEQNKELRHLEKLVKNSIEHIHELPQVNELRKLHNETESLLQEANYLIKDIIVKESIDIKDKILKSKEESKDTVESLRIAMANNSDHVGRRLHDLSQGQLLMVSMADDVLDTKKKSRIWRTSNSFGSRRLGKGTG
ncbi:hypothetical protein M0802_003491 [Mischocyttarus mexicanus]|nr:hypothetical protein M0802_003491 [Mischocyttarus mexicanus]